jgi:hypothetical protein
MRQLVLVFCLTLGHTPERQVCVYVCVCVCARARVHVLSVCVRACIYAYAPVYMNLRYM